MSKASEPIVVAARAGCDGTYMAVMFGRSTVGAYEFTRGGGYLRYRPCGHSKSHPTHDAAARAVVRLEIARLRAEADRLQRALEATPEGSIEP